MVDDCDALLVTGFWLSACVATPAIGCAERLAGRLPVIVPLSLAATRVALYDEGDDHPPEADVHARLEQMRAAGVTVCESFTPGTYARAL